MPDRILTLVNAQAARREAVETRSLRILLRLAQAMLNGWYNPARVKAFASDAADVAQAAQQAVAGSTAEYLDAVLDEMGVGRAGTSARLPSQVRKIDPAVEWQRPAEQFRYERSVGRDEAAAQKAAVTRATILLGDDIALAQSVATTERLVDYPKVTGYRRVIHPELSRGGTCGLCAIAADRVYKANRLMPIHARCACGVMPVTADFDPGSPLNADSLRELYDQAGSTAAAALKRTRFKVVEHSELGPQLLAA